MIIDARHSIGKPTMENDTINLEMIISVATYPRPYHRDQSSNIHIQAHLNQAPSSQSSWLRRSQSEQSDPGSLQDDGEIERSHLELMVFQSIWSTGCAS